MTRSNSSATDYGSSESDNTITYEFKPELIICDSNSVTSLSTSNNNSANYSNNIDQLIREVLDKCQSEYKALFYNTVMEEVIEDGYICNSQKLYEIINDEFGHFISSSFLNSLYVENALNNKLVKSLLYIIAELTPEQLNGFDIGIVAFAISNEDYETKDLALQCFAKWNDLTYLDLLKSLNIGVEYLDEYREYIIKKLEKKREK